MSQLILGTAEFNPEGYAGKPCPDEREIFRILELAYNSGIRWLDTAEAYHVNERWFGGFHLIRKSRNLTNRDAYYHYKQDEKPILVDRASIYTIDQITTENIVPMNINNTVFCNASFVNPFTQPSWIARSVFDRGRLLEQGWTIKDCLNFVKRHNPKGIIVGVCSVKELEEILKAF